jgi:ABC-type multidrug transport system ATPase subunit
MTVTHVTDVSFRYSRGAPWILRRIHAEIKPGAVIRLTGRNGAGKSTLLRLLAGILAPVRGEITERPAAIGYAPERFPSRQPFTVRRYLEHLAAMRGSDAVAAHHQIGSRLDLLGLTPFEGERLSNLSKGTAQKVGLAQASLGEPQLLLLDEPWAGLDRDARHVVPVLAREVVARGGSVVFSDHEQRTAALATSAQWEIRDGVVAVSQTATPTDPLAVLRVEVPKPDAEQLREELRGRGYSVSEPGSESASAGGSGPS